MLLKENKPNPRSVCRFFFFLFYSPAIGHLSLVIKGTQFDNPDR